MLPPELVRAALADGVMLRLFLCSSIPMIERKLGADKPAYGTYRARTPMLVR